MDDAPPPTEHIIRPHHVGLLTIFVLAFKEPDAKKLPAPFALHIYRSLLKEVAEVAHPPTHRQIEQALLFWEDSRYNHEEARRLIAAFQTIQKDLETPEQMTNFFGNLPSLFVEKSEDEPPVFMRRSLFGYFCRRCFVSFLKLSFSGVTKLQRDYQSWCVGGSDAGYEPIQKDQLSSADQLMFKTQADKKSWAKPDAYEAWEKGHMTGDENIATENLRRFFEQHFHENNDSGVRQHALLNLVRMHYLHNEIPAARKLLSEAIVVARTSGDRITLQHCISMLHRLPPTVPGRKPALNEIQADLHPLEVLFDVSKILDEQNEQPLSVAFAKIEQAVGLYDHWLDVQLSVPVDEEQLAQHAVQSIVWTAAGCAKLASIEELLVVTFTEIGGESNNRISVLLNRAYKEARQGSYEKGLVMLLEPHVWHGLSLNDYVSWANEIWHILALRATRRGQHRLFREVLVPRRPAGSFNPREYLINSKSATMGKVCDLLYDVIQLRECDQASTSIEQLLKALWHSEFLFRLGDYRTGIILLADVGLEFGMWKRSQRILHEIMPQIINGNDVEQRAFACYTMARCLLCTGNSKELELREALRYLLISERDFQTLEIHDSLDNVRYLISVAYHNLGMEKERDEASKRYLAGRERDTEPFHVDPEVQSIFSVIDMVGAALAARK